MSETIRKNYSRKGTYDDARILAELWVAGKRETVIRQIEDRIIVDRACGMMLLVAFIQVYHPALPQLVDEIQAWLAPDVE